MGHGLALDVLAELARVLEREVGLGLLQVVQNESLPLEVQLVRRERVQAQNREACMSSKRSAPLDARSFGSSLSEEGRTLCHHGRILDGRSEVLNEALAVLLVVHGVWRKWSGHATRSSSRRELSTADFSSPCTALKFRYSSLISRYTSARNPGCA